MLVSERFTQNAPKDLIVVGAGGFAAEVLWAAEAMNQSAVAAGGSPLWNVLGCCVYDPSRYPSRILSYPVLGTAQAVARDRDGKALHYISAIGDNRIRQKEVGVVKQFGWRPVTLIHPTCQIASNAIVGPGTYIAAGAVVAPNIQIGSHVVINFHVSIGHDTIMGDFSQASPGTRILGRCQVGSLALLGANATLLPGVALREGAVLGANSVAVQSIPPNATALGIPARIVHQNLTPLNRPTSK